MGTMKIKGMYGFNPIQLDLMIQGFNICLKSRGIEQSVKECWETVIDREKSRHSDAHLEIAAWALERAVTLRVKGVTRMNTKTGHPGVWAAASCPPETKPCSWSREVIGFSNMENIFKVSYYNVNDVGLWQRPSFFMKGEAIKWWIDKPDNE